MLSAVMPASEASLPPLLPPPPGLFPPQAASVVATVNAAARVTRRREGLVKCSPSCGPGHRCPGVCGGVASVGLRADGAPAARLEPLQPDRADDARRGEDDGEDQDEPVDERGELGRLGVVEVQRRAEL